MVRNLLLLLILVSTSTLFGQFSYSPTPISINTAANIGEIVHDVYFTNSKDSTYTIFWKIEKPASFDPSWEVAVCDLNLCYQSSIDKTPATKPNVFTKTTNLFQFHFKPNGVAGTNTVGLKLYADKNFTIEVLSTVITLNASTASSTKEQLINAIKLFPNPATDYIQISNGLGVKKVVIYNIFGKEIKTYFHYNNAQHEISDLKSGMYIVKLIDEKNKVIKTLKLNKAYDGV